MIRPVKEKRGEWLKNHSLFLFAGTSGEPSSKKEHAKAVSQTLFGPGYGRFLERHLIQFSSIPIVPLKTNSRQEGKTVLKYEQSARVVRAATSLLLTSNQETTNNQAKIL